MSYLERMFSLRGRQAVVTGAARGNGLAIAEGLLRSDAEVVLVDIEQELLKGAVSSLEREGLRAHGWHCDLADRTQVLGLVEHVRRRFPETSILVNNAGVTYPGSFMDYSEEQWDATHAVNLKAPFLLSQKLAPVLARGHDASIINITSLNAELAFPGNPAYVAFKGALRQLTRAMALDLAEYGIRVNSIGPGYIRTAMTRRSWDDSETREARARRTMLGRWGEPDDLAGAAVFLASKASAYITGQDIYVDGGWLAKGL
jgi:NAD(P)-dependent dehydrogenase (short-subunit alcohol dehydrogenase family)